MSLFVICLLVAAVGIALILLARLLVSYPLAFAGVIVSIGAGVLAILDEQYVLGIFWFAFSIISAVTAGLYFYKNIRGAFWWCLGAVLGIVMTGVDAYLFEGNEESLLPYILPAVVFVVIGLIGSLVVPRLIHKDKNQRKHATNVDPIIGQRVTITKDKENGRSQRGYIGDIDWAIEPLFSYESFKVGDVVKVEKIKGVTLLCTRDGKDYRKELKDQRKAEAEAAKARQEEKRKAKEAAKAKEAKEEPKKEEPKVEEPKIVEEPKKEEPVKEEPKVEPVKEEPKKEEPAPEPKEKAEFVPFAARMKSADPFLKEAYNELKSEVLSYGIKSRISSTSDTFRLHTKAYVKMVIAGKYLKLYLALNPADYKDTTYPFDDASRMGAHKDTPFVFKIKSGLSVRRAKVLIADAAKKDGLVQGEVVKHNHAKDVK